MNKDEFDRIFEMALEDAAKKLPSPNPDLSWSKIEDDLKHIKIRSANKWIPYTAIAASFLLGALMFSTPAVSNAFSPLVSAVKHIQSGVVSFVFGNRTENDKLAKTAAPPETAGQVFTNELLQQTRFDSWEEAKAELAFSAPEIGYVPESYQLNQIVLFSNGTMKAHKAVLLYSSENASYQITIRTLDPGEVLATGSELSDGNYEEIQINGYKGFLFTNSSVRGSLDFMRGSLVVSISGQLPAEELVNIAKGISLSGGLM